MAFKLETIMAWLKNEQPIPIGAPVYAGHNAPFVIPAFGAEILIKVK